MEITGDNTFGGKGANANNTFSGTITVTVDQVLANGNLHVVGEKQIAINQGTEFIRFSGVVNPRTISGSNSVTSTQVADARISMWGMGISMKRKPWAGYSGSSLMFRRTKKRRPNA